MQAAMEHAVHANRHAGGDGHRPRVLHYLDSEVFGGCEEIVLQLIAGMDRRRWNVSLLHRDSPGLTRLLLRARALGVSTTPVSLEHRSSARRVLELWRHIRQLRPAVFHAHLNWPLACRHALVAARLARVPAITATAHVFSSIEGERWASAKSRLHVSCVDRFIAVSDGVRRKFLEELNVPRQAIDVVYNGIEPAGAVNEEAVRALREELRGGSQAPVVLNVARLHPQKGHPVLLRAVRDVPEAIFVIAGTGPEHDTLVRLADEFGVSPRVRFLGERTDVPALLAACDLFVLPSYFEGLPVSLLEAMRAGRPVVAADIDGVNEVVSHEETGLVFPAGDAGALAGAIRRLLACGEERARLARAGQLRAAGFSRQAMVDGVAAVYDRLLNHSPRPVIRSRN